MPCCCAQTFPDQPVARGSPCRMVRESDHVCRCGRLMGDFGGRVGAGVVDEDDVEVGVDLLLKEAGDGAGDDVGFVASGDDNRDGRASGDWSRRLWPGNSPEATAGEEKIDPCSE